MTLHEIIDSLIDLSEVSLDKRGGDKYEQARQIIHDSLNTVDDVEAACFHEAGHWAQAFLAAHQLDADGSLFKVVGPTIKYNRSKDTYDATPTGLKLVGMEGWRASSEDDVKIMARIAVAGGESILCFYGPSRGRADGNDIGRFKCFCRETRGYLGGIINAPHVYLNEATTDVRRDFQEERFKILLRAKTELIKRDVFGPVFRHHT